MSRDNLKIRVEELEEKCAKILALVQNAQKFADDNPEVALTEAGRAAEAICKQIYINGSLHEKGRPPDKMRLDDLVSQIYRNHLIPERIYNDLRAIQHYRNMGAHHTEETISRNDANPCLCALSNLVQWFFEDINVDIHGIGPAPATGRTVKQGESGQAGAPSGDPMESVRRVFKSPLFQKLAVGVMAATGAVLANKGISKHKEQG
jgi:hypothetical protein